MSKTDYFTLQDTGSHVRVTQTTTVTVMEPDPEPPSQRTPEIHSQYQVMHGWGPEVMYVEDGIHAAYNRGGGYKIAGPGQFEWDADAFKRVLDDELPEDFAGIWTLDIEGLAMAALNDPTHDFHGASKELHFEQIDFAKRMRPDAKIGLYGQPGAPYWDPTTGTSVYLLDDENKERWRESQIGVQEVLDLVDVVTPSIYDNYSNQQGNPDDAVHGEVVARAVEMAKGKRVLPFGADRWWGSLSTQYMTIGDAEIRAHWENARDRGADGVIMWAADIHYFTGAVLQNRFPGNSMWNKFRDVYAMFGIRTIDEATAHIRGMARRMTALMRGVFDV